MSRRKSNIDEKIKEMRTILEKYSRIPSEKEDRIAYAKIKYYVQKHGDDPRIKELIDEYKINFKHRVSLDFDTYLQEIKEALLLEGRIPSILENQTLYCKVRHFFKKFSDKPEVEKLKYIYAHSSRFPLQESKASNPGFDLHAIYLGGPPPYTQWRIDACFDYIRYVFSRYSELPARNSKPMQELKNQISIWYYDRSFNKNFCKLICDLVEDGCIDEKIIEVKNSFYFDKEEVHNRIRAMLIEHGRV